MHNPLKPYQPLINRSTYGDLTGLPAGREVQRLLAQHRDYAQNPLDERNGLVTPVTTRVLCLRVFRFTGRWKGRSRAGSSYAAQ
jgi:hypothetical protein